MKAEVDQETCIGCGACASICAEVFKMNDNGLAQVETELISGEFKDCVIEAENTCPVEAISHEN